MELIKEADITFRFGDHGPKYFMKGPRASFGICKLLPGEIYAPHKHARMEENFYVLAGRSTFIIDGVPTEAEPGDFIHLEPGEAHQVENQSDEPCIYVINTCPFIPEGDKILL